MGIKVSVIRENKMSPFIVEFSNVKKRFTREAAIELKNKLQSAIDELDVYNALRDINE